VGRRTIVIFVLALVVRLAVVIATADYVPRHDDRDYDRIAWSMAQGHGYPPVRVGRDTHADAYRPPLWPAVLGAVYAVAGHRLAPARVAQAVLGALGTAALSWVALRLLSVRAAWWAGIFGAVYLPLALVSASLLSETLFVALELTALALALEARERGRGPALAAAAGAAVALAALTRFNGVLLLAAVLPLVPSRGQRAAALAAFALVVAPWTVRNAIELHAFVPVSTESGTTLIGTYNLQSMTDRAAPGSWQPLHHGRVARLAHEDLPPAVRDADLRDAALRFVERHPAYPLAVAANNLRRWLDLAGFARARFEAHTADVRGRWVAAMLPFAWGLAALATVGIVTGAARGTPPAFWLAPALLLASTLLVNAETPRFRAPIDPFLILLAVAAVPGLRRSTRSG
jgi:4-amino-4-deoxy-L-arabinose transferase-like glycosyltransferase